ncbi:hypothetical protein T484DRAFT_1780441 [Baffinella frigidus]|nr:hypothetical protein T484DRAFT_1780441 [Cryptophyta sp. CCMP2293]
MQSNTTCVVNLVGSGGISLAEATASFTLLVRNDTALVEAVERVRPWSLNAPGELAWVMSLFHRERKVFSQNSEDGVIEAIFDQFGHGNMVAVEIGAEDGSEAPPPPFLLDGDNENLPLNPNARLHRHFFLLNNENPTLHANATLHRHFFLLDGDNENLALHPNATLHRHFVTADNIAEKLRAIGIMDPPDLLSVDIDYNDFWVLRELLRSGFAPRVIIAEVNRNFPPERAITVSYSPWMHWSGKSKRGFPHGTCYYGMSPKALYLLGRAYGYVMVHVMTDGVNAVLLRKDMLSHETPSSFSFLSMIVIRVYEYVMVHVMTDGVNAVLLRKDMLSHETWRELTFEALMPHPLPGAHQLYEGEQEFVEVNR